MSQDEEFQAKVKRGGAKNFAEWPTWKPMQRGFALSLENLREFLEMDFAEILLNTFVDKNNVKKYIEGMVTHICSKKEEMIPLLFQEYRKTSKKDVTQSLKTLVSDYTEENPDVDFMRIARELPVILSLLCLKQEGYIGLF